MIRLYHGSNTEIDTIDLAKGRPFKDFGQGFYLTELKEQAIKMSSRTADRYGGIPTVTEFDFDMEHASDSLNIKLFDSPNEEWAKFVMRNRRIGAKLHEHDFDIVIGPVADDDIAYLIRNFENGFIDMKRLLEELQFKRFTSQYFFHSPESIKFLHKC